MSGDLWHVQKHVIPAAHIRGAPRGVKSEESPYVKLALNQYTPKAAGNDHQHPHNNNVPNREGALTIILVHGVGCSKESFEPFLDDLLTSAAGDAPPIRSIWVPDSAFTGESYTLNKDQFGDAIHLHDFARDVLHMINTLQAQMPPPLVGMGFSMGCGVVTLVSAFHPRLFSGIVFLEPGMGPKPGGAWTMPPKFFPGVAMARRRDVFASRELARAHLRKSPYSKAFDERVVRKVLDHEFRPLTKAEREESADPAVRDAAEPLTFVIPNHVASYEWMAPYPPLKGHPPTLEHAIPASEVGGELGFYSPYALAMLRNLQYIHAPVLTLFARNSRSTEADRVYILDRIGVDHTGSGGVAAGKVDQVWIEDATHPVPLEKPTETARAVVPWLAKLKTSLDAERQARKAQPPFLDRLPQEWLDRIAKL